MAYIGAKVGTLVTAGSSGDVTVEDATPEVTLKNTTETDADGSRGGKITFKGVADAFNFNYTPAEQALLK